MTKWALSLFLVVRAASAATFLSDSGAGSDGTTLDLHVGQLGAAWTKCSSYSSGSAVIDSNRIRTNTANQVLYLASTPSLVDAYTLDWDYTHKSTSGDGFICFQMSAAGTFGISVGYNNGTGKWEVQWVNGDTNWASLGASYEYAQVLSLGTTYHVQAALATGTTTHVIKVYIDSVERISALVSGYTPPHGMIGIRFTGTGSSTTGSHLSNLVVSNAEAAPSFVTAIAFALSGDSNHVDYGRPGEMNVAQLLGAASRLNTERFWDFGVSGQTVATMITNGAAEPDSRFALTSGYGRRLAILAPNAGSNDLAQAASAATLYTRFQTWCAARRSAGYLTLVGTIPKNKSAVDDSWDATRISFNALLDADHSFSDYYVDAAAFACFANYNDATFYQSDGTHWTLAGATGWADGVYSALQTTTISANQVNATTIRFR